MDALRGTVAVANGPIVYCADQADNTVDVDQVLIAPDARPRPHADSDVGGFGALLEVDVQVRVSDDAALPLYGAPSRGSVATRPGILVLRPYARWGNAEQIAGMRVWVPQAEPVAHR